MAEEAEVAIAGGGAIGLCTALHLRAAGREVVLIDRGEPGGGASFGNAGVIANYECIPVGTPGVLRSLPRLLFDPASPLSIAPSAVPRLSPWLLRFASASHDARARRHAVTLAGLLKNSLDAYASLIEQADAGSLLCRHGALHIFRSERELASADWSTELRHSLGVRQVRLQRNDLEALEPHLPADYRYGILYPDAAHLLDPFELMRRLARAFQSSGGEVRRAEIARLSASDRDVTLTGEGLNLRTRTVVLALGAWSATFARQVGDRIPLETERGYHVEFPMSSPPLTRPVCPVELGFYLTPMAGRLRAAGTVELSSIRRPPNPRRLTMIERHARQLFPQLPPAQSTWLGFRPSLPDSLPVIGRSPRARNIVYAFGHGHLGVTLAAETARLVTDLIERGREPPAAVSPARFS